VNTIEPRRIDAIRAVTGIWVVLLIVLAACGSGNDGGDGPVTGPNDGSATGGVATGGLDPSSSVEPGGAGGDGDTGAAMATLVVGGETYSFEGNQWTYCEIGGLFPANAEFQTEQEKHSGAWVQFIDRGDGGIHFSALIDAEEYTGTGAGEADEITSNGLVYTGTLNRNGEVLEASLEVSCG
jgi:hypothetical protein